MKHRLPITALIPLLLALLCLPPISHGQQTSTPDVCPVRLTKPGYCKISTLTTGCLLKSDRPYKVVQIPSKMAGAFYLLRDTTAGDTGLNGEVVATVDCTVYVAVISKWIGKVLVSDAAFRKLEEQGWKPIDDVFESTTTGTEEWRWRVVSKPIKAGTALQFRNPADKEATTVFFAFSPQTDKATPVVQADTSAVAKPSPAKQVSGKAQTDPKTQWLHPPQLGASKEEFIRAGGKPFDDKMENRPYGQINSVAFIFGPRPGTYYSWLVSFQNGTAQQISFTTRNISMTGDTPSLKTLPLQGFDIDSLTAQFSGESSWLKNAETECNPTTMIKWRDDLKIARSTGKNREYTIFTIREYGELAEKAALASQSNNLRGQDQALKREEQNTRIACSVCKGSGKTTKQKTYACPKCEGSGYREGIQGGRLNNVTQSKCVNCGGSGKIINETSQDCTTCNGVGQITQQQLRNQGRPQQARVRVYEENQSLAKHVGRIGGYFSTAGEAAEKVKELNSQQKMNVEAMREASINSDSSGSGNWRQGKWTYKFDDDTGRFMVYQQ